MEKWVNDYGDVIPEEQVECTNDFCYDAKAYTESNQTKYECKVEKEESLIKTKEYRIIFFGKVSFRNYTEDMANYLIGKFKSTYGEENVHMEEVLS